MANSTRFVAEIAAERNFPFGTDRSRVAAGGRVFRSRPDAFAWPAKRARGNACTNSNRSLGVAPMIGDRAEPLAAIYPKGADSDVIAALSGPDFSLQSLAKRLIAADKLRLVSVSKNEENYFRNFNKPGDFM